MYLQFCHDIPDPYLAPATIPPTRVHVVVECPRCGEPVTGYYDADTDEALTTDPLSGECRCPWNEYEDAMVDDRIRDAALLAVPACYGHAVLPMPSTIADPMGGRVEGEDGAANRPFEVAV